MELRVRFIATIRNSQILTLTSFLPFSNQTSFPPPTTILNDFWDALFMMCRWSAVSCCTELHIQLKSLFECFSLKKTCKFSNYLFLCLPSFVVTCSDGDSIVGRIGIWMENEFQFERNKRSGRLFADKRQFFGVFLSHVCVYLTILWLHSCMGDPRDFFLCLPIKPLKKLGKTKKYV